MSTRSLTYVRETENSKPFLCIYRQCDGYPEGMGKDLKELLSGYRVVNGYGMGDSACAICNKERYEHKNSDHELKPKRVANGINCLAATLVKGLKDGIGNVYLYPSNTKSAGQEYEYNVYLSGKQDGFAVMLKVVRPGWEPKDESAIPPTTLYVGKLDDFTPAACKEDAAA